MIMVQVEIDRAVFAVQRFDIPARCQHQRAAPSGCEAR